MRHVVGFFGHNPDGRGVNGSSDVDDSGCVGDSSCVGRRMSKCCRGAEVVEVYYLCSQCCEVVGELSVGEKSVVSEVANFF